MVGGCLAAGGGIFVVDALLKPTVSVGPLAAALALVGFGLGLALVAVTAAVLAIVPAERSGMAASTVNTSRQLGGVLAVAILGAIINERIVHELGAKLAALDVPVVVHGADHPRRHRRRPAGECRAGGGSRTRRQRSRPSPTRGC